jgi:hypothetical protein
MHYCHVLCYIIYTLTVFNFGSIITFLPVLARRPSPPHREARCGGVGGVGLLCQLAVEIPTESFRILFSAQAAAGGEE